MKLGVVIGNVVATRKNGNMGGRKILVVRYLDDALAETGITCACIDTVDAGVGDVVLVCASSSARVTAVTRGVATDSAIVGIVDEVSSGAHRVYRKNHPEGR
jgi:microcompartment protein CcmK/EutM